MTLSHLQRAATFGIAFLLVIGCKKTADNSINYRSAIDTYFAAHPSCLWSHSQQFPTQVGASDDSKNAPFAALVDQGLLSRTTSEKKIIIVSKQEINYDLTDKGRAAWTSDPNQPGYGNFCYGHRTVSSIDSSTPNSGQPGATTQVGFHYSFSSAPDWTKAPVMQTAFPRLQTDLAGNGVSTATLIDTNNGWAVQGTLNTGSAPATSADGSIVQ